jgi:hypothetical protein
MYGCLVVGRTIGHPSAEGPRLQGFDEGVQAFGEGVGVFDVDPVAAGDDGEFGGGGVAVEEGVVVG